MGRTPDFSDDTQGVAIIGAGFAGLGMAMLLTRSGRTDFTVYEAAADIGGTWRDNTYPGCGCDVASHLYSYSFEPNPAWSRAFSPQEEIRQYMLRCVDTHRLWPSIRLGCGLTDATWIASQARWRLTLTTGEVHHARVLVSGVGGLRNPSIPQLPGADRFAGPAFHTARWNHGVDLRGKRVGVVGTGASAIQVIPAIAPAVAHLDVFQRTPAWVVPKPDRAYSELEKRAYARIPGLRGLKRLGMYWNHELLFLLFRSDVVAKLTSAVIRRSIALQVKDPAKRAALTPRYRMGCKRVLLSNDYYAAMSREHVAVVDDGIDHLDADGVVTADGVHHPLDVLVYATGFRVTDFAHPATLHGIGGVELGALWRAEGAQSYYGTTVAGFPNLFLLAGPNTAIGHTSMLVMLEAQCRYVLSCLDMMDAGGLATMAVQPEAQARFSAWVQSQSARTAWLSGCKSWYLDAQGRNVTLWPAFTWQYARRMRTVRTRDYHTVQAVPGLGGATRRPRTTAGRLRRAVRALVS